MVIVAILVGAMALAWQVTPLRDWLAAEGIADRLDVTQGGRWYRYSWDAQGPPLPASDVLRTRLERSAGGCPITIPTATRKNAAACW